MANQDAILTEKHKEPMKHNSAKDANVRPWITFPVLDWFLYPLSLRKVIHQLMAEGDFRSEGLYYMHVRYKWIFIIGLSLSMLSLLFMQNKDIIYYILVASFVSYAGVFYIVPRREILPYSIGMAAIGVVSHSEYHTLKLRVRGWLVWYAFTTEGGREIEGATRNVDKEDMDPVLPEVGRKILVFYDVENPRNNSMFAPVRFDQECVSITRYAKREELCTWGVKHNG